MRQYTRFLHINSKDRTTPLQANTHDFVYRLERSLDHVHRIDVDKVIIPFSYYVINEFNNNLVWTDTAGTHSVLLTPGNYTLSEWEALIETTLESFGDDFTVSVSTIDYKITITQDVGSNFGMDFTGGDTPYIQLGENNGSSFAFAGPGPHTRISPNAINLNGTCNIELHSQELSGGVRGSHLSRNRQRTLIYSFMVTQGPTKIMLDENKGQTQYTQDRHFEDGTSVNQNSKFGRRLQDIDIQLRDDNGNLLDLNGVNWCLSLRITGFDD